MFSWWVAKYVQSYIMSRGGRATRAMALVFGLTTRSSLISSLTPSSERSLYLCSGAPRTWTCGASRTAARGSRSAALAGLPQLLSWFKVSIIWTIQSEIYFSPCLVTKFKIPNLSHRTGILHAWSIKSRRNKKRIAWFAYKLRDESNEHN